MSGKILDFNTAKRQDEVIELTSGLDVTDIKQRINLSARDFVRWLFSGRAYFARGGREARIGDTFGNAGASLSISLDGDSVGQWHDHATGESGDLLGLYIAHMGYHQTTHFGLALKEVASEFLGDTITVTRPSWEPSARQRIEAKKKELGDKPREDMVELGAPVREWKYLDTNGRVIASVIRYEPDGTPASKTYRPFCFKPDDHGVQKWMMGAPTLRPLYRLPEISLASTVVLVEGEKCAEALAKVGVEATTAMQGAKAPIEKTDWAPLHGKTVIIWPDNDEPGFKYATEAAGHLRNIGCTVRIVTIPAGKPEKWDAADFIAEGGEPQTLIGHATDEAPAPSSIGAAIVKAEPFLWIDPSRIPPREWIYGKHYVRKFLSSTVAPGGVGKSSLAIVELLAIATGRQLLGVEPDERCNTWYWNGEDPMDELQRRIMAVAVHHGLRPEEMAGRFFVNSGRASPIVVAERTRDGVAINVPVIEQVIAAIEENKIGVMTIDPFVSCHRVTENDNSEIERVAKVWAHIADATGCSVELVHHVRKTNGTEVTVEDGRGAVALLAAARAARAVNRMSTEEGQKAGIEDPSFYFRTDNGKANLAPPAVASWFHLASVDLHNDTATRPGDKIGVVESWVWPDHTDGVTGSDLEEVMKRLRRQNYRANPRSKDWVGYLIIDVLGRDRTDQAAVAQAKTLQNLWMKNGAIEEVEGVDEKRMKRTFVRPVSD